MATQVQSQSPLEQVEEMTANLPVIGGLPPMARVAIVALVVLLILLIVLQCLGVIQLDFIPICKKENTNQ